MLSVCSMYSCILKRICVICETFFKYLFLFHLHVSLILPLFLFGLVIECEGTHVAPRRLPHVLQCLFVEWQCGRLCVMLSIPNCIFVLYPLRESYRIVSPFTSSRTSNLTFLFIYIVYKPSHRSLTNFLYNVVYVCHMLVST